jgi:hypothetical protein
MRKAAAISALILLAADRHRLSLVLEHAEFIKSLGDDDLFARGEKPFDFFMANVHEALKSNQLGEPQRLGWRTIELEVQDAAKTVVLHARIAIVNKDRFLYLRLPDETHWHRLIAPEDVDRVALLMDQTARRRIYFYETGKRKAEGVYEASKGGDRIGKHGKWTYYHPNGQKAAEGEYEYGTKVGLWSYWDASGFPASESVLKGIEAP